MSEQRVDPHQWVRSLATALDTEPPSEAEIDDLLSLAGTAAHTAERWVAPISCWLVARADLPTAEGRALVERLAAAAADPDPAADPDGGTDGAATSAER